MDQIEFRAVQAHLELTQPGMADFLGCSRRKVNGMANGDSIPKPVAMLLRLAVLMHLTVADIPQ
jgi:DNA-binding XRE family transcriptional regulator